jgi:cell wall-associated NlpC family hydrolase
MVRKTKNPNDINSVNPVHPVNPETTEPASLRSEMSSHIAMFMAIVMSAMGLATITPTAAQAATSTVKIQTADRAAAPGEFTVRSIAATKNETKRLYKINRVAGKKAEVRVVRNKLVAFARKQIGDPYRAGRSGPDAFDCSGLVRYVYKEVTGKSLPHYSKAQYQQVQKIKRKNAQPGDLVFFFQGGAHHVGIYIGKGKMIDAPNTRKNVRVSPITGSWWGRSYTGMGRMLPA